MADEMISKKVTEKGSRKFHFQNILWWFSSDEPVAADCWDKIRGFWVLMEL